MAKVVKGALKVVGAVASVVALIPSPIQPIAAAVATVAAVASTALEVISPTKPRSSVAGSQTQFKLDPNAGIPYAIGRTGYAGNIVHRDTWGKDNQYQGLAVVYSLGPVQAMETHRADDVSVTFDGAGNANGFYRNWMFRTAQLGATPSPALSSPVAGFPGVTASTKYSGYCVSHLVFKFDTKEGKKFPAGLPRSLEVIVGPEVYDPRQDSTFPGGSGSCRALDFDTYVGGAPAENPWIKALTLALGIYHNDKRVFGVGAPIENINVQSFVDCANVADANAWKAGGMVSSTDDKWEVLKMLAQAGGGQIMRIGGTITAFCETPRISVATIREEHLIGKASVAASQLQRSRKNGVVPIFRSEAHGWEQIPGDPVRFEQYVTEDGRRVTDETEFVLVQNKDHAAELAAYEILNSREIGPIDLPVMIQFLGVEPGDQVDIDIDNLGLQSQEAVVLTRQLDPTTAAVQLGCRSETTTKHATALGTTTTVPPSPTLSGPDLSIIPPPDAGSWTPAAAQIINGDTVVPIIRVTGATDLPTATGVMIEYRPVTTPAADWKFHSTQNQAVEEIEISQVTPNTQYEVAVSYVRLGLPGERLSIGTVTTGNLITGTAASAIIADNIVGQAPAATDNTIESGATRNTGALNADGLDVLDGGGPLFVGEIPGARIAVGAVGATHLDNAQNDNLNLNPDFRDDAYWDLNAWTLVEDPSSPPTNVFGTETYIESPEGDGTQTASSHRASPNTGYFLPVEPGKSYRFRASVWIEAGFTGYAYLRARFVKNNAVPNTWSSIDVLQDFGAADHRNSAAPADAVHEINEIFTVPADAHFIRLDHLVSWSSSQNNAGKCRFAGATQITRAIGPDFAIDGAFHFGQHITLEDGLTLATDAALITSLGTSASSLIADVIVGQAPAATDGTIAAGATRNTGALADLDDVIWGSQYIAQIPTELTDGRITAGLNSSGILQTNAPIADLIVGQAPAATDNTIESGATRNTGAANADGLELITPALADAGLINTNIAFDRRTGLLTGAAALAYLPIGDNILPNPTFANSAEGYANLGAGKGVHTAGVAGEPADYIHYVDTTPSYTYSPLWIEADRGSCRGGETLFSSGIARSDAAAHVTVYFDWYDEDGTHISSSYPGVYLTGDESWENWTLSAVAPAGAVAFRYRFRIRCLNGATYGDMGPIRLARTETGATFGADWSGNLLNRPVDLTDGRISLALDSSGILQTNAPIADVIVGQAPAATDATIQAGATVGADWGSNLLNRPGELTDGRISVALDASGILQTNAPLADFIVGQTAAATATSLSDFDSVSAGSGAMRGESINGSFAAGPVQLWRHLYNKITFEGSSTYEDLYQAEFEGLEHVLVNDDHANRVVRVKSIPYDSNRKYKIFARVWAPSATSSLRIYVPTFDHEDETFGNFGGWAFTDTSVDLVAGWQLLEFEPTQSHAGAKFISACAYMNDNGEAITIALEGLWIEDVTDVDAAATTADFGSVTSIPTELTDGRILTALDASGILQTDAPTAIIADNFVGQAPAATDSTIEAGADVTANQQVLITPPTPQTIYRDYQGTIKPNQLPRTLTPLVKRGGTDIRTHADATYSITANGVTATVNNTAGHADKGRITVTAGSAGNIQLTVTVSSVVFGPFSIPFTAIDDDPPQNSGSGSTSAADSTLATVTTTSFAQMTSQNTGESLFTISIASGDDLVATAPLTYQNYNAADAAMTCKWQYRLVGNSTWIDFPGGQAVGSNSSEWYEPEIGETFGIPGNVTCNRTKTGLAAGDYEVRLVGKTSNASYHLYHISGTASVAAQ